MQRHLVPATTHGRVLLRPGEDGRVLVAFHGYAENASIALERLRRIPGAAGSTLIAIQALNRFYRGRTRETVASWMTREDRERVIADNLGYVDAVLDRVGPAAGPAQLVLTGFSQGVAMAFRAAARGRRTCGAVIAVGGDVPPDLLADPSVRFPRVLLLRGEGDEWYTQEKLDADVAALAARGGDVTAKVVAAGHEWNEEVDRVVGAFLAGVDGP